MLTHENIHDNMYNSATNINLQFETFYIFLLFNFDKNSKLVFLISQTKKYLNLNYF